MIKMNSIILQNKGISRERNSENAAFVNNLDKIVDTKLDLIDKLIIIIQSSSSLCQQVMINGILMTK